MADQWRRRRVYWRLVDKIGTSLLSVDLDGKCGLFLMLELLLYNGRLHSLKPSDPQRNAKPGLPQFDLSLWPSPRDRGPTIHDVVGDCRVQVGGSEIRIELFNDPIVFQAIYSQDLAFEFNHDKELCAIALRRIPLAERVRLLEGWRLCRS